MIESQHMQQKSICAGADLSPATNHDNHSVGACWLTDKFGALYAEVAGSNTTLDATVGTLAGAET